jgi:hypothetical protein
MTIAGTHPLLSIDFLLATGKRKKKKCCGRMTHRPARASNKHGRVTQQSRAGRPPINVRIPRDFQVGDLIAESNRYNSFHILYYWKEIHGLTNSEAHRSDPNSELFWLPTFHNILRKVQLRRRLHQQSTSFPRQERKSESQRKRVTSRTTLVSYKTNLFGITKGYLILQNSATICRPQQDVQKEFYCSFSSYYGFIRATVFRFFHDANRCRGTFAGKNLFAQILI